MKKYSLCVAFLFVLFLAAGPVSAALMTGTPVSGSGVPSPAFGTLIDFDDQLTGTAIGATDYVSYGVASITETEGLGTFARYGGSQSSPNYIGTGVEGERGTDANNNGWDGTILFEFTGLASMVGIGVADSKGDPEILSIFDSDWNLLDSDIASSGTNVYNWFDYGSSVIKYFQVTGDFFALDDLQHNASAVPEPATLLLLGMGLLGIGGFGRRKIRKK